MMSIDLPVFLLRSKWPQKLLKLWTLTYKKTKNLDSSVWEWGGGCVGKLKQGMRPRDQGL